MENQRLLVLFLAGDNHISNVKTLQSIYRQDYSNICLVVCNDCTDHFQSERLLNNFQAGRPEGVQQIIYHENPQPMGEYLSQSQFWDMLDADYVITLHAGEYLLGSDALTKCVKQLASNDSLTAVVASVELWSDDMKKMCARRSVLCGGQNTSQLMTAEQPTMAELRDCMLMCRLKALRELNLKEEKSQQPVSQMILSAFLEQEKLVLALPFAACRYSIASISSPSIPVPTTYGNESLQAIETLLESNLNGQKVIPDKKEIAIYRGKNRNLTLYKYSRRTAFKWYVLVILLLLACATLLLFGESLVRMIMAEVLIAIAGIVTAWTAAMLIANIYFKNNPQRLGF